MPYLRKNNARGQHPNKAWMKSHGLIRCRKARLFFPSLTIRVV
ncbi:hypothetical protein DCCM_2715 [Desulfocucumis palustris]|uniref:Uncharacterized protein n=1 Tax=Desulfocucumis palustris TaxID=1898651 RepID=A0A2L2XBC5_9FIRM|nr:hypothetical protein DCCM_2715 [Desulfocucumis palustris]